MQFITNGPDIPDALLQAQEEGRVVFFCGAGIAYPAGLPGFKGLVEEIYKLNGTELSDIEQKAFVSGQYDATLDLLEHRLPGHRLDLRRALAKALKPKMGRKGAINTHTALLTLARSREDTVRLVTTNFDRLFHKAAKRSKLALQTYSAPMLPIPKNSRWNGLVYLHGVLPEKEDDTALNRLVVTSGDFGLAYLIERWAARFVSELFRNYVVCFVGYSINDPVLRYMMDALAADRLLGESSPEAWALGECEPGMEALKSVEWEAKGVNPILYEVPKGTYDHSALHDTLQAWGETYRDGVLGKERIVVNHALAKPSTSTRQDDFVGRMLWALSDRSGLPAKRFAQFNPAPSLDWLLDSFSSDRFGHSDLSRFGVPPLDKADEKLRFSLIHRPTAYPLAPRMAIVSGGPLDSQWDYVMAYIAQWLARHLDDPRLIIWIAQRGGHIHERSQWLIANELDRYAELESNGKFAELDEIRSQAPKAIPRPIMRTLWRLLLSGRVKSSWRDLDLYRWKGQLQREGLTPLLRLQLRDILAPQVVLRQPFRLTAEETTEGEPTRIKQLVDWELVLAADHVHSTLQDFKDEQWGLALPLLLEDFQQLLRDALDLLGEMGERGDRSHWALPSITPHWQNRGYHDWVTLIELLRDAWLTVLDAEPTRAAEIAERWFGLPYPTFKRLALFAASQTDCIAPETWVAWLLCDRAWWLWTVDTGREMFRLLVLQGARLTAAAQQRLEDAILAGPPRDMYRDMAPNDWQNLVDHSVWLRLAKLQASGLRLELRAAARFAVLSDTYPEWQLAANERDEFSHWMSGTGDPDFQESRKVDIAPHKRAQLVEWLKNPKPERRREPLYEDTWRSVCRKHLLNSLCALQELAGDGVWPTERWREALQVWSEEKIVSRSWRYGASLVVNMPDSDMRKIIRSVSWWIEAVSKSENRDEKILFDLCRRVLSLLPKEDTSTMGSSTRMGQPVTEAINHPVGHVTETLLNIWLKKNPSDNDRLPLNIELFFNDLCDTRITIFRHARVLLASRLIPLFRVDPTWTKQHILPLFDWNNSGEAKAMWEGFLWSPRLYQPLLIAFKESLLGSASRYDQLGEHSQQFAAFLTYAALDPMEGFTNVDFRTAFRALPKEGLEEAARALSQALEASDQRENYWKNRVQPFWRNVWPKSSDLASPRISESLARMIIAAKTEFPAALKEVESWLRPIEHPHYVLHLLRESGLCKSKPVDALSFINALIKDQQWISSELQESLDQIVNAAPSLAQDMRYRRLLDCARKGRT